MKNIGVIGAGSFGTALAITLASKGHNVTIWGRNSKQLADMRKTHINSKYLPGAILPENLLMEDDLEKTAVKKDILVFSVPTQQFRSVLGKVKDLITPETIVVNVAKGIEKVSLLRLSQVAEEIAPKLTYVTLSGPSHAEEVAQFLPTTVAVAGKNRNAAKEIQEAFITDRFRVYTNDDIIGVELGGALKNIIALGAGISDGMGFGDNAKAALMTRGIAEIKRLGVAMGANLDTFAGLTGIGDLIVTCTSMHSRNRRCGILIGQGKKPQEAAAEVGMVVEGISTAEAAYALSEKLNIEMPITQCLYMMIHGDLDAESAVSLLMGRNMKNEMH